MANEITFKNNPVKLAGHRIKAGDKAPDFECLKGLNLVKLADTAGKLRLFSVVPSLDTGVCSAQTKKFNDALAAHKDKLAAYTFSLDLPFAQGRFCDAEGVANMETLSDVHNHSFGKNYGVLIEGGLPLPLLDAGRLRRGQKRRRRLRRIRPRSHQPPQLRGGHGGGQGGRLRQIDRQDANFKRHSNIIYFKTPRKENCKYASTGALDASYHLLGRGALGASLPVVLALVRLIITNPSTAPTTRRGCRRAAFLPLKCRF